VLAVVALALVAAACATTSLRDRAVATHVLLLSIDGLRPEFYLDPSYPTPNLKRLVVEGAHARGAEGVFPTVTYPSHASVATGVRPVRHGVAFNLLFVPDETPGRWYERAADLRVPPLWDWARGAGLSTAAVAWPSTVGAKIDWLLAERDYYLRRDPLPDMLAVSTPGMFERLGVKPDATMFKEPRRWDAFLTSVATAVIRQARPNLLMLHLVQVDVVQHEEGREGAGVRPALARLDAHVGALRAALAEAGIADRTTIVITGDHGFQDVRDYVYPNHWLARAGLRGCPRLGAWHATTHAAGGAGAVFVNPPGDLEALARAEDVLRREAADRFRVITRRELDELGAMPGAALAVEAAPGWAIGSSCDRGPLEPTRVGLGTHGFLPSRASMATGFVAAGAGVRRGVALERTRLIDVAPTVARLLGVPAPAVEGRVLAEILE
jgi:predicted AlkP superfamily pyrophosphatase or phosphodiesterase